MSYCNYVSSGHIMVVTVTCQVAHLQKLKKACYNCGMHATIQSRIVCLLFFLSKAIGIYRPIVLPVILCACETWCVTLKEECRLKVFENRVLKKICGPKWQELTGEWRKLHIKELHDLYCSPNIRVIKEDEMGGVCGMYGGEEKCAFWILVGKPEGKRPLGSSRHI